MAELPEEVLSERLLEFVAPALHGKAHEPETARVFPVIRIDLGQAEDGL